MKVPNQRVSFLVIWALCVGLLSAQSSFGNDIQTKSQDSQSQDYRESLDLQYVMKATNDFAPAYIDYTNRILLVWRYVRLQPDQVPFQGPHHRSPIIDLAKTKYAVHETTPPVRYLISEEGGLHVGYYDRNARIFFVWQGFEIKMPQAGLDAYEKRKLTNKEVAKRIEIPIPASFWSKFLDLEE